MAYELKENQHTGNTYSTQNNMGPIRMVLVPLNVQLYTEGRERKRQLTQRYYPDVAWE